MKLRVGDKVRRINNSHGNFNVGDIGTIIRLKNVICDPCEGKHAVLDGDGDGYSHCQKYLELVETKKNSPHPVGTTFSVLNEKEAEPYIGRKVECIDNDSYRDNGLWKKGILKGFRHNLSDYPFNTKDGDYFHLIRLIPESFETPKPKVAPKLIEALKKSIQQWQIMYDTGKKKDVVYRFLGGVGSETYSCFLCDFTNHVRDSHNESCVKCISWGSAPCFEGNSPFRMWSMNKTSDKTLAVLNHLKSELVRLESESK